MVALIAAFASAFAVATAQAEVTHEPLFQLAEPPSGPRTGQEESIAVYGGHVWIAELGRLDEWDAATGAFLAEPIAENVSGKGVAVGRGSGEALVYVAEQIGSSAVVSIINEAGASKGTWKGAATPGGSFDKIKSIAVDNSNNPLDPGKGDVFVELGEGVVDVFHPEADGEERFVQQIEVGTPGVQFRPNRVAVDEANGDLLVARQINFAGGEPGEVDVFEPTGAGGSYVFARKLSGPPPSGFEIVDALGVDDSSGEIYVVGNTAKQNFNLHLYQFSATGAYVGQIEGISEYPSVAVNPESPDDVYVAREVYSPDIVIPDVTTGPASDVTPEGAQLNGTVNGDGMGTASCQFDWGTTPALGKSVPCAKEVAGAKGEGAVAVQATLGGLGRDTTYYYRLQASNAQGTNPGEASQTVSVTTGGVEVSSESVTNVAAEFATLHAMIDPHKQTTSYYFQYGSSTEYGQQAPAVAQSIGAGEADGEAPGVYVQGLTPDTEYHYRVVVVSQVRPGEVETLYGEDRTFTTQGAGGAFSLPDGRRWELVSPPDKFGALIEQLRFGAVQASAAGDAIAYRTNSPSEGQPPGYAVAETMLSTRGAGGWSSQDISSPHNQAAGSEGNVGHEFLLFSSDLSQAAVQPFGTEFTPLSPEASQSTAYLRSDFPAGDVEAHCDASCYRPLVTATNTPPGTVFGEEPTGSCERSLCGPRFEGASSDLSHVILSSPAQLTETPAPTGAPGVYEWSAGGLRLVGVLPVGEAGPAVLAGSGGEIHSATGVRHAVSDDGERVILEGGREGGEGLYLREVDAGEAGETLRLDALQGGAGPSAGLRYMTASSDASRVFFLDSGRLTAGSSASGEDLYEYDLNAPPGERLTDLTVDEHAGEAAEVMQVIGASEDGSYVYFLATGVLAEGAKAGELNLYVRHEGVTKLVAPLPASEYNFYKGSSLAGLFGRVSPDGRWLTFMSRRDLTGYDTHDAVTGEPDVEVYLYDAAGENLVCASCDPTGARPVGQFMGGADPGDEGLADSGFLHVEGVAANVPPWLTISGTGEFIGTFYQPRYLSDSGRLFFDSADALVPQDVNGTEDVYEWEPAGVGSCAQGARSGSSVYVPNEQGCVSLISSGASPAESAFLDAGETGGDVFFLTQSRLAPQDYDTAYDVYDAHECTSTSPCPPNIPVPPPCENESSCRAAPLPQPALYGAPASATFNGTGNLAPTPTPVTKSKPATKSKHAQCQKAKGRKRCPRAHNARRRREKGKTTRARRGGKR